MDIALAKPERLSLDRIVDVIGIGALIVGAVLVGLGPATDDAWVGAALVAVGTLLLSMRYRLAVRLESDALVVRVVTGRRRFPYDTLSGARTVEGPLVVRYLGVSAGGYHTGVNRVAEEGRVRAYLSRHQGPYVLLERTSGRLPIVLSPADPPALIDALAERGVQTLPSVPGA